MKPLNKHIDIYCLRIWAVEKYLLVITLIEQSKKKQLKAGRQVMFFPNIIILLL